MLLSRSSNLAGLKKILAPSQTEIDWHSGSDDCLIVATVVAAPDLDLAQLAAPLWHSPVQQPVPEHSAHRR